MLGAEVRVFNPAGLPIKDEASVTHPKVVELRDLSIWSEAQVSRVMLWLETKPCVCVCVCVCEREREREREGEERERKGTGGVSALRDCES